MDGVSVKNDLQFYASLTPISEFARFSDPSAYRPAPESWVVVVCDIEGSTKAVAEGRYKQVNMLGSACIMAALNVCGDVAIAYEFGGDGASLLVPEQIMGVIGDALCALQSHSLEIYGMRLRVGAVGVDKIRARGEDVQVAKFELSAGNYQAMFTGGGLALADNLVKADTAYALYSSAGGAPDLAGLSCRWEPLRNKNGVMVTLLVMARGESQGERNKQFAAALDAIIGVVGRLGERAPANEASLKFVWPPRHWRLEAMGLGAGRVRAGQVFTIFFEAFFQKIGHKFGLKFGDYDAPVYKQELKNNTDYRRFGDMIRLVIDCDPGADSALRQQLGAQESSGGIYYGLQSAENALMTCLVFDLAKSRHIHFIDGGNGGFTLAAKELKCKIKAGSG